LQQRPIGLDALGLVLGQYWHPIHHFPQFLAAAVLAVKDLQLQSRISLILFQELGQGDFKEAHEFLFLSAAKRAGISDLDKAIALPATMALVNGYVAAASSRTEAIGYLFATEMIDLRLVRTLGTAIKRASRGATPRWLSAHEKQEVDHVATANDVMSSLSPDELTQVVSSAKVAWNQWHAFCDGIAHATKNLMERP
jgi:hypothetical protein